MKCVLVVCQLFVCGEMSLDELDRVQSGLELELSLWSSGVWTGEALESGVGSSLCVNPDDFIDTSRVRTVQLFSQEEKHFAVISVMCKIN